MTEHTDRLADAVVEAGIEPAECRISLDALRELMEAGNDLAEIVDERDHADDDPRLDERAAEAVARWEAALGEAGRQA